MSNRYWGYLSHKLDAAALEVSLYQNYPPSTDTLVTGMVIGGTQFWVHHSSGLPTLIIANYFYKWSEVLCVRTQFTLEIELRDSNTYERHCCQIYYSLLLKSPHLNGRKMQWKWDTSLYISNLNVKETLDICVNCCFLFLIVVTCVILSKTWNIFDKYSIRWMCALWSIWYNVGNAI